jgi:hypothetical protein
MEKEEREAGEIRTKRKGSALVSSQPIRWLGLRCHKLCASLDTIESSDMRVDSHLPVAHHGGMRHG